MGSLQSRFRRFKRKPGSDLMLYRALRSRTAGEIAANDYLKRLGAAGLRVGAYDAANRRLIERLVENGGNFWPDSGAFCAMAGYLYPGNGANLIPLHPNHDAGTLNAFVTGDWNAVTGLIGRLASSTYIALNRLDSADGQDDFAFGTYITEAPSGEETMYILYGGNNRTQTWRRGTTDILSRFRSNLVNAGPFTTSPTGLLANSRDNSADFITRIDGAETVTASTSRAPQGTGMIVMGTGTFPTNSRHPFYHAGPNLSGTGELAELDSILTDWKTDLANA